MAASATTTATDMATAIDSPVNGSSSSWMKVLKGVGDLPEITESISREDIPATEGNAGKKPVWNKPVANAVSPPPPSPPPDQPVVMGADSWPALSESTRLPLKSSDSPKSMPEVSLGPKTSNPQPPKQANANTHQNSSMNYVPPNRVRPNIKRGGGGGGNRQGGFVRETPPHVSETSQSNFGRAVPLAGSDSSSRDTRPIGGFPAHPNSSNDHSNHRGSNRRGNFWRGNGRNNYHGGRHNYDHRNHDWSSPVSSHGRGAQGHPHRPRGFVGPAVQGPPIQQYGPAPHMRPFMNPMYPAPDPVFFCYQPVMAEASYSGMPYVPPSQPPTFPVPDTLDNLRDKVVTQIEYYFSDDNLVKDYHLKVNMDEQGWVPISVIALFPRVVFLNVEIPFILSCLSTSNFIEVQGDKVRRREGWMKWILRRSQPSSSSQSPEASSSQSPEEGSSSQSPEEGSSSQSNETRRVDDNLSIAIQGVSLEENNTNESTLNEEDGNSQPSNVDGSSQHNC